MDHTVILKMLIESLNRFVAWIVAIALLWPELGRLIRKLRGSRSREQYAADLGASSKSIARWEAGEMPGALFATRIYRDAKYNEAKKVDWSSWRRDIAPTFPTMMDSTARPYMADKFMEMYWSQFSSSDEE